MSKHDIAAATTHDGIFAILGDMCFLKLSSGELRIEGAEKIVGRAAHG